VDRYHQVRVRNALEPEWEARFEPKILWLPAGPQLPGRNRRYLRQLTPVP